MLVVTHEATLTGAPMNLLHFVRWIVEHTDVEVHTLMLRDGPLHERFRAISSVTALDHASSQGLFEHRNPTSGNIATRLLNNTRATHRVRRQVEHLTGFDLIYLNSIASLSILQHLDSATPVVCHVHEMGVALASMSLPQRRSLRRRTSCVIAASQAVSDDLVAELDVDPSLIRIHHEFIDARRIAAFRADPREVERLRRDHDIPDDAAIVMGAGTLEWRKGPEMFVQLVAEVARRTREPVRFVWVGGNLTGMEWTRLWADCARAGVRDLIRFVGTVPHPETWFASADVFVLTSHEDPFPLVCLEHAAMGHPVVTFRNGGMVELLEEAGPEAEACIVSHLDVGGMAERVLSLLDAEDLQRKVGQQLRGRVLSTHDVSFAAPRLWNDVEEFLR